MSGERHEDDSLLVAAEALLAAANGRGEALPDQPALAGPLFESLLREETTELAFPRDPRDENTGLLGPGDHLGTIRLDAELGRGGMGRVLRGYDEKLGRPVAIKSVRARHHRVATMRSRFRREAQLLSRLNHPGICHVYDLIERPEADYLVFELVEGETLREWLPTNPPSAERLAAAIAVVDAVAAAHKAGVVHRDLKPENIMRRHDGSIKVLDFGIAREIRESEARGAQADPDSAAEAPATLRTDIAGTPAYMSPEQQRGELIGAAADVWALGIVIHELLTGSRPLLDDPAHRLVLAEGLDQDGMSLIRAALAPEPTERPAAVGLLEGLRSIADAPARRRSRQRRLAFAVGAGILLVATAAVTTIATRPEPLYRANERPRVAVLPIENATTDSAFDWVELGLAEMVSDNFTRIDGIDVIPFPRVQELLAQPGRRTVERAALADELGDALGATVTVAISATRRGEGWELHYRADRPGVQDRLRSVAGDDAFSAAAELSERLRQRLAPEASAVDLRDQFSANPLTNQLFALGLQDLRRERPALAEPAFVVVSRLEPELDLAKLRLAEALVGQTRLEAAEATAREVVELAQRRGDFALEAEATRVLGEAAYQRDDRPGARDRAIRVIELAANLGRRDLEAGATFLRARAERFLDRPAASVTAQRALDLYAALGDELGRARTLHLQGVLADESADPEGAERLFLEALAIGERLDAPRVRAVALDSLAILASNRRDYPAVLAILEQADTLSTLTGDRRNRIYVLNNFGDVYQSLGRLDEAHGAFAEGEALCADTDAPTPCALLAWNYAELLLATGYPPVQALPLIERSEAFFGADDPDNLALRAFLAKAEGHPEARSALLRAQRATSPERAADFQATFDGIPAQ